MSNTYHSVALDEEPFLNKQEDAADERYEWKGGSETSAPRRTQRFSPTLIWLCHAVLLSLSVTFFALSFCSKTAKMSDVEFTQKYSAWSPAAGAVQYVRTYLDLPPVAKGPYVGRGDRVDAQWDHITNVGETTITREEMTKLGLDSESALAITDAESGEPAYRVDLEVFHQLRCLNLIRKDITRAQPPSPVLWNRLNHCVDALRQFVMCQSDVGVVSYDYGMGDGKPLPNYGTPRMCRNFESVRQWAVDHAVPKGADEPEH